VLRRWQIRAGGHGLTLIRAETADEAVEIWKAIAVRAREHLLTTGRVKTWPYPGYSAGLTAVPADDEIESSTKGKS
jgi:hypothetical protein